MAVTKYQRFETETISRSQIKNAPYNPRIIDEAAKKRLRKVIATHGLIAPLQWNRRTGNLVGGHQRLEALDAIEPQKDYEITVSVIDVDEREEAQLNVILNNPDTQGDWDIEKLAVMADEFDLSFESMGFDKLTIEYLFDGDEKFTESFNTPEADEVKGKLREIKEDREKMSSRLKDENSINWYTVIVFRDEAARNAFHKEISVPASEKYISEEEVRSRLKKPNQEVRRVGA